MMKLLLLWSLFLCRQSYLCWGQRHLIKRYSNNILGDFIARRNFVSSSQYRNPIHSPQQKSRSSKLAIFEDESDPDYRSEKVTDFIHRDSRVGFVRKVYGIFTFQMLTTIITLISSQKYQPLRRVLIKSFQNLSLLSIVIQFAVVLLFSFKPLLGQQFPLNLLLLAVFTIASSLSLSISCLFVKFHVIAMALVYTLVAFGSITLYSFQNNPKYDLTAMGNILLSGLTTVTVGSLINGVLFRASFLESLLGIGAAVIAAGFIAVDTQMIISGRKQRKKPLFSENLSVKERIETAPIYYNSKDYIAASMNLYLDVLILLKNLIKLLHNISEKESSLDREE